MCFYREMKNYPFHYLKSGVMLLDRTINTGPFVCAPCQHLLEHDHLLFDKLVQQHPGQDSFNLHLCDCFMQWHVSINNLHQILWKSDQLGWWQCLHYREILLQDPGKWNQFGDNCTPNWHKGEVKHQFYGRKSLFMDITYHKSSKFYSYFITEMIITNTCTLSMFQWRNVSPNYPCFSSLSSALMISFKLQQFIYLSLRTKQNIAGIMTGEVRLLV